MPTKPSTIKWPKARTYWSTHGTQEIADALGCHRNTVCQHRLMHDLPSPPRKGGPGAPQKISDDDLDLDATIASNAKRLGCTINWAGERMRRLRKKLATTKKARPRAKDEWL